MALRATLFTNFIKSYNYFAHNCSHNFFPTKSKIFVPFDIFGKRYAFTDTQHVVRGNDKSADLEELKEYSLLRKKKKTSKAMRAYLKRAEEYIEFIKQQMMEYNVGKRHLANMMGENPETFTQKDIDSAIEYLFPSGLYQIRARPTMKPPEEVFPSKKAAQFDSTGRPYHFLFYTVRPNFSQVLHDIATHMEALNAFEDKMISKQLTPDSSQAVSMSGFQWLSAEALSNVLVEKIPEAEHDKFTTAMTRLVEHPYSYRCLDFIDKYRKPLMAMLQTHEIPKPEVDADGRQFVTTTNCWRKRSNGVVTVRFPGTGKITVNGKGMEYFPDIPCREQLLFPLIFCEMLNKVDVEATIEGSGPMAQAGAIRYGISMGLRSFVDERKVEEMRIAGLLQVDWRTPERKKPGQMKARRKFTWKKR